MKPIVYLETSVISYLTARPSRDLIVAAHQQLLHEWWDKIQPQVECVVSPFVLEEIAKGDKQAARRRLELVANLVALPHNDEIEQLAHRYFTALQIPEKSKLDAFHLAIGVWHQVDYILSWNCSHIVNTRARTILQAINSQLGLVTPIVCTPEEFMEV
jgi:predicted nucleic acid-binding protein